MRHPDATITVMSQNGSIDLNEHAFRLFYSRRDNDRLVARIVAEKEGIVKAQIEPEGDGKDQAQAFLALRRHVEIQLDSILSDVPGAANIQQYSDQDNRKAIAGPSRSSTTSDVRSPPTSPSNQSGQSTMHCQSTIQIDAPPAYGKAVKEWRSDEKKT